MDNAIFGLIGVIVGALLTWAREWLRSRWDRKRQARYLAVRVVCIFDEFHETCVEIAHDDGTCMGQRNAEGYLEPQIPLPDSIPFPDEVDWTTIDHSLMYKILSLPSRIKTENAAISFVGNAISSPPDFDEYFEERQYRYAVLGMEVFDLAKDLRRKYDIPDREFGSWDPVKGLQDKKDEIERQRTDRARQQAVCLPDQPPQYIASSGGGTNG